MNPASVPTAVKDVQGDGRWMSQVRYKSFWIKLFT